jgi:hypothetical protein
MKIEVGKRYLTRNGEITTPLILTSYDSYKFAAEINHTRFTWTEDGKFLEGTADHHGDLVEEYVGDMNNNDIITSPMNDKLKTQEPQQEESDITKSVFTIKECEHGFYISNDKGYYINKNCEVVAYASYYSPKHYARQILSKYIMQMIASSEVEGGENLDEPPIDTTNLPDGWKVEYKGKAWDNDGGECYYVESRRDANMQPIDAIIMQTPSGDEDTYYWELIPPTKDKEPEHTIVAHRNSDSGEPHLDTSKLPEGWTIEYRGLEWNNDKKRCYYTMHNPKLKYNPAEITDEDIEDKLIAKGIKDHHYWELIPPKTQEELV